MGDAWTWWDRSVGEYTRGQQPSEGAVLVFRRSRGMPLGHVSTVTAVVDSRTILVDHSFGGPVLWRDMPIVDTSAANDWSQVRVWHGPTNQLGSTDFPIYGFVYPASHAPEIPTTIVAGNAVTTAGDAMAVLRAAAHPTPTAEVVRVSATVPTPPQRPLDAAAVSTVNLLGAPTETDATAGWTSPDVVDSVLSSYLPRRPPRRDATPAAAADPLAAGGSVHIRRD